MLFKDHYYIGEFKNGLKNGKGVTFWNNGDPLYEGDYVNDKPEGFGKGYIDNGDYYIGEWKNGEMDGEGTLYDRNGRILFKGNAGQMNNIIELMFGLE